jgi:hypothetical protein
MNQNQASLFDEAELTNNHPPLIGIY